MEGRALLTVHRKKNRNFNNSNNLIKYQDFELCRAGSKNGADAKCNVHPTQ
jgi:hypothetical protein